MWIIDERAPLSDSSFQLLIEKTDNTGNLAVTGNTTGKFMKRTYDTIQILRLLGIWKHAVSSLFSYTVNFRFPPDSGMTCIQPGRLQSAHVV